MISTMVECMISMLQAHQDQLAHPARTEDLASPVNPAHPAQSYR